MSFPTLRWRILVGRLPPGLAYQITTFLHHSDWFGGGGWGMWASSVQVRVNWGFNKNGWEQKASFWWWPGGCLIAMKELAWEQSLSKVKQWREWDWVLMTWLKTTACLKLSLHYDFPVMQAMDFHWYLTHFVLNFLSPVTKRSYQEKGIWNAYCVSLKIRQ